MHVIALMQGQGWCPMCGSMGSWGWSMMIFWPLMLAVIVAVVWYAARGAVSGGPGGGKSRSADAEETIRQRYARGEIDRETFIRMRDDLQRQPPD